MVVDTDTEPQPGQPDRAFEAAVFETCWRRYKDGERDLLDGGVATSIIADHLDATWPKVARVLERLEREGVLVELHGATPTDLRARTSWAPLVLHEGGGADE